MIQFNQTGYCELLEHIQKRYQILNFSDASLKSKKNGSLQGFACLRHDIDYCLQSAFSMAKIECGLNISSSYFFLIDSPYYNVFDQKSSSLIRSISNLGHEICLHFDVSLYPKGQHTNIIRWQQKSLEKIIDKKISAVSYHCPDAIGLENLDRNDLYASLKNTYAVSFNNIFHYISDYLCRFREKNVWEVIKTSKYKNIHLLIHPIWWIESADSRDEKVRNNMQSHAEMLWTGYQDFLKSYGVK